MSVSFEQFAQAAAARSEELLGSARDATRRLERAIENLPAAGKDRERVFFLLLNLTERITRDLELAQQHDDTGRLIVAFATGEPERNEMAEMLERHILGNSQPRRAR